MLEKLFNKELQDEMEHFFLNELALHGQQRSYPKGSLLEPMEAKQIYVVLKGKIVQKIYTNSGDEVIIWTLRGGTIFGEMDYFEGDRTILSTLVEEDAVVSVVNGQAIEDLLVKRPEVYRFFMHSITRKFRVMMLEYTNIRFNDVRGRIADRILRQSYLKINEEVKDGDEFNERFTHERFAKTIGVSRSTLTSILKEFEEAGLMVKNKHSYKVLNVKALEALRDGIW